MDRDIIHGGTNRQLVIIKMLKIKIVEKVCGTGGKRVKRLWSEVQRRINALQNAGELELCAQCSSQLNARSGNSYQHIKMTPGNIVTNW